MVIPASFIKDSARQVGFDACGIAPAGAMPRFDSAFRHWLAGGNHAAMGFLERNVDVRSDPRLLLSGARTIVSVLVGYKPSVFLPESRAKIACYAYGEDYHEKLKRMLFLLMAEIQNRYPDFEAKPCVDTAPISDKLWAWQAGLGWIGKNTLLVNPEWGSFCNIGELVTPFDVDGYDSPIGNRCGDCHRCVDACPNGALQPASTMLQNDAVDEDQNSYLLRATCCTAYNTIENRSSELPSALHTCGYAFGCDICQLACPYNQKSAARVDIRSERAADLLALEGADETAFRRITKHSAMDRISFSQWHRNIKHTPSDGEAEKG